MANLTKEQIEQKKLLLQEKLKEVNALHDERVEAAADELPEDALEQAAGGVGYYTFSGVNPSDPTQVV